MNPNISAVCGRPPKPLHMNTVAVDLPSVPAALRDTEMTSIADMGTSDLAEEIPPPPIPAPPVPRMIWDERGAGWFIMRIDCEGNHELDDNRFPIRVLRILIELVRLDSARFRAKDKAMIVNLEFFRAIITSEEVWLLDPLHSERHPFSEILKKKLVAIRNQVVSTPDGADDFDELPFQFRVLVIASGYLVRHLSNSVTGLVQDPALNELAVHMSHENIANVLSLRKKHKKLSRQVKKVKKFVSSDIEDIAKQYLRWNAGVLSAMRDVEKLKSYGCA